MNTKRHLLVVLAFLFAVQFAAGSEWFDQFRPGITRAELHALAPVPLEGQGDKEGCVLADGRLEFVFRGDVLFQATYFGSFGSVRRSIYSTHGVAGSADDVARRAYLRDATYGFLPSFGGEKVRTARFQGLCYEVDGQYLVIEPITQLMGASGFFSDKTARVLLVQPDGSERLLYRACDYWQTLRPSGLSVAEAERRVVELRWLGPGGAGTKIAERLGPRDSHTGSTLSYSLYYLPDGLLVILDARVPSAGNRVLRVGRDSIKLDEWLQFAPPGVKSSDGATESN